MIKDKKGINFYNTIETHNHPRYKNRRKKYFGHTWLGWLNYIVFQWFCVRLTEVVDYNVLGEEINSRWEFTYWIVPLSGWKGDFKYIGRNK